MEKQEVGFKRKIQRMRGGYENDEKSFCNNTGLFLGDLFLW
jgi:hypothetical protein